MKIKLTALLKIFSGNYRAQKALQNYVSYSQKLMGIGSGAGVNSSGEKILLKYLKIIHNSTSEPLCIFDVGANKGQFLNMILGGLQNISYTIHAFEPSEKTFGMLSENFKHSPNVLLNNFGLGKTPGEFSLFYDKVGSGMASLSNRRLDHFGIDFNLSEEVKIETLEKYCERHSIQNIDLLKLDVEGHEIDVLNGGEKMFYNKKIQMISFEFGGCNIDSRTFFQDFWYFFKEHGNYDIFRITPTGYLMPILEYQEIYEQFRTTNFLAIRQGENFPVRMK